MKLNISLFISILIFIYNLKAQTSQEPPRTDQQIQNDQQEEQEHVDIPPITLNMEKVKKKIKYPQIAQDAGIEGTVIIRYLVDDIIMPSIIISSTRLRIQESKAGMPASKKRAIGRWPKQKESTRKRLSE